MVAIDSICCPGCLTITFSGLVTIGETLEIRCEGVLISGLRDDSWFGFSEYIGGG